jgi:MoaA/NifB/PqqE/SkfB family radical SAM enzyme
MTVADIAWIDTIDACHLKCPTCLRGARNFPNTSGKMDLATYSAIVDRLREQGYSRLGLFNWTEPFLNRDLDAYVARAKRTGFWTNLSSTLSLRRIPHLEPTLCAGVDLLTVSVSGSDQAIYEINHVGGTLEYVWRNLETVREIITRHGLPTRVDLRMLRFEYNAHQEQALRGRAASLGCEFELVDAVGHPQTDSLKRYTPRFFEQEMAEARDKQSPEDAGKSCELMFRQIAIDWRGDVYICCAMPIFPSLRIGRFLDLSADEILAKRFTHPFCRACTMPRRERTLEEHSWLERLSLAQPVSDEHSQAA